MLLFTFLLAYHALFSKQSVISQHLLERIVEPQPDPKPSGTHSVLFKRLEVIMAFETLFLNLELTLATLATKLKSFCTTISRAIRDKGYDNFRLYLNKFRVEEFEWQFRDGKCTNIKEAYQVVVFNFRSVFYRAFMQIKNMTPAKYLHSLTKEGDN